MQRTPRLGLDVRSRLPWAPLALVGMLACVGCQSFAPASGLAAKHREQKIVKQAANDPFPSPSDVGLGERTRTL